VELTVIHAIHHAILWSCMLSTRLLYWLTQLHYSVKSLGHNNVYMCTIQDSFRFQDIYISKGLLLNVHYLTAQLGFQLSTELVHLLKVCCHLLQLINWGVLLYKQFQIKKINTRTKIRPYSLSMNSNISH